MNIFAFTGPAFLAFYSCFGTAVLLLLNNILTRLSGDLQVDMTSFAKDPYKIACLRGGRSEAILVATLSLCDRGLLQFKDKLLQTSRPEAVQSVNRSIEKAILSAYLVPAKPRVGLTSSALNAACDAYKSELGHAGLIATAEVYSQRLLPLLVALLLLVGTSWIKIHVALSHGHHNIAFLIMLTILFSLIAVGLFGRRTTGAGRQLLANLRGLFFLLKSRAKKLRAGGETNEVALVTAVFGLGVISANEFPLVEKLRNQAGDSGSSCSSSSSSCGSSCGGGGCGGCGG